MPFNELKLDQETRSFLEGAQRRAAASQPENMLVKPQRDERKVKRKERSPPAQADKPLNVVVGKPTAVAGMAVVPVEAPDPVTRPKKKRKKVQVDEIDDIFS